MNELTCIIFAGGAGTRLWPMSRKNSPKQFAAIKNNQSTLQMAVERVASFGIDNLYISTNERYKLLVQEQIPNLAADHIFLEPAKRDQAPAVGLTLMRLKKQGVSGPVAILWSDHLMDYPDKFVTALEKAGNLIQENPNRFIFIGETPRFANHNLGWINIGEEKTAGEHRFLGWKYRPEFNECKQMFNSKQWLWNTGYFVTDIDFLLGLYKRLQPAMFAALNKMVENPETINNEYPQLASISFDNAIVEKTDLSEGTVLKVDLGWSDPGTLYAFKEAFSKSKDDNYTKGNTINLNSKDCFVYNEDSDKLLATVGLKGMIVVNTKDAILVCKKEDVPRVKELLKEIESNNLDEYL